jgi:hypothetical protein
MRAAIYTHLAAVYTTLGIRCALPGLPAQASPGFLYGLWGALGLTAAKSSHLGGQCTGSLNELSYFDASAG